MMVVSWGNDGGLWLYGEMIGTYGEMIVVKLIYVKKK